MQIRRKVSWLRSAFFRKGWIGLSPRVWLHGPPGVSSAVGPRRALVRCPRSHRQQTICCVKVALAALCISGWSAFGYEHWSFAAAERDRLAETQRLLPSVSSFAVN